MDGLSAFVCSAQALQYALSVIKSLAELRSALKNGGGYLRDEQAGIVHLREIIIQLARELTPNDKTRLNAGLESHLKSISYAVSHLLRLLQQQTRLQVAILLVVRRAELHDSFALLERKKTTLNLYLTTQNTVAIASIATSAMSGTTPSSKVSPYSPSFSEELTYDSQPSSSVPSGVYPLQDVEAPSRPEHPSPQHTLAISTRDPHQLVPQSRESRHSSPFSLDQHQLAPQLHEASVTPDHVYYDNTVSGHSEQDIYAPIHAKTLKTSHGKNESHDHSLQKIGQPSLGRKPTFPPKSVGKKLGGGFHTKGNIVKHNAEQHLYAPDNPNTITIYVANVSDTSAKQNLGIDVGMDLPTRKPKKRGLFRK